MLNKEELGRRLRMARFEKGLTLKEVAARCGMSATHISEVERGKTSPTIGALQRISEALEENPAHFVREESFPRILFTPASEGPDSFFKDAEGRLAHFELLSRGLPDGILQITEHRIAPGTKTTGDPRIAESVVICLSGMVRITTPGDSVVLREGDTLQFRLDGGYEIEILGDEEHHAIVALAAPVLIPT